MTAPIFRAPSSPAASPAHAYGVLRHGFASFYASPVVEDMDDWRADIAFVGVPFDAGTNDRPGARFGPAAIRDASMRYRPEELWSGWIDAEHGGRILAGVSMADVGDVNVRTVDLLENFDAITQAARMARRSSRVQAYVGGDHAITFPLVRAYDDTPLTLVQFDAHQDYTDEKAGVRFSHDNHMRRSSELRHVRQIANIGLRGVIEHFEPYQAAQRDGVIIVPAERIVRAGVETAMAPVTGGGGAYVTVDIDVLDPSGAPGTGYPEPGGITYYHLRDALRLVAARYDVVAFDICEVDPIYDAAGVTTRIAAKLALDFLGAIIGNERDVPGA